MQFEDKLFQLGITSFMTDIITLIPATPQTTFQIGKTLSEDVGYVYGISTYADSVDETGTPLPTTTDLQNIWLKLKNGSTEFYQNWRMDDLLNVFSGTPEVRDSHYRRVSIPRFDISKSEYGNPTGISSAAGNINIHLKLWYIQNDAWQLVKKEIGYSIQARREAVEAKDKIEAEKKK